MHKSLVAVAVIAAAGVSYAQVTVSGNVSMGYKATTSGKLGGPQASGLGVDTSAIDFSVKEEIARGQTLEVSMGLAGADRSGESSATPYATGTNGPVTGRNAAITYTNTSFGQIKMSTAEGADYFSAVATVGAPIIEMDGKLHETKSSSDHISYTVPLGPLYLNFDHGEGSAAKGLGVGSTGSAAQATNYQNNNTVSVYYSQGPLTLLGAYRSYDNRKNGPCALSSCPAVLATKDEVLNLQAAYDLGAAKVGLGYQQAVATSGATVADAMIAISAPVGAWTLGAAFSNSRMYNAPDTSAFLGGAWDGRKYEGTAAAYSIGASYALSKRTSVVTRYATWTHSGYSQYEADGAAGGGNGAGGLSYNRTANETSVLLSHAF